MGGRRAEIEAVSGIDDQSAQFSRHDTELGLYWLVGCLEDSHPRPALWRDRILTPRLLHERRLIVDNWLDCEDASLEETSKV